MTSAVALFAISAGAYLIAVLEGWSVHGRLRLTGPAIAALALLARESFVGRKPDRVFYEAGPILLLTAGLFAAAVIPLTPNIIVVDLATGALFLNAALAYVLVAIIMAGWGPNGAYGMIGGWRFLGQFIAYAMLIVMPITAVAMRAESLMMTDIVASQAQLWNAVYQPLGFLLFVIASMGLAYLPPFDLPIACGDLAGGVEAEYTGVRLSVMRLARMVVILSLASATATFYLGGWLGPWLPAWVWSTIKILAIAAAMLIAGPYAARIREAHYLALSWKLGISLALANIFLVGVLVLAAPL
ncbi:NADH-quinone oxidoreductase subunit H [Hyphococcus sp.]|uniref:NADH-quinone oxidoreductase subunit H n=1 Tax=Hyphococcus sp. TaxID=2038636 RepID=UPI003D0EEB03